MNSSYFRTIFLFLLVIGLTSCKSRKETVTRYKYLTENKEKPEAAASPVSTSLQNVLDEANSYLGTPYRYGGIGKNGIDCSGLTQKCFEVAGVGLPRSASGQSDFGERIGRSDVQVGDLVFFSSNNTQRIDHVGMVVKVEGEEVTFIHASTSKGVRHDRMDDGYWKNLFRTARRINLR